MSRWLHVAIAWLIIAAVAVVQERSRVLAGILAAMPLSIPLAMWIVYAETRDLAQTARFTWAASLALIATLAFVLTAGWLLSRRVPFGWSLAGGYGVWLAVLLLMRWLGVLR
ncbi:hypothetical protein [Thermoflexus hugenholtzii]|jgi:hypothetical protein|uniref:DUF3147 family protein n=1 Tax=Thermoflexus hugenholtzii JAD2 TaxID=877466 RepID=A0A212R8J8_9CHLR|nr:hypothetical protein [Thermoflexus hugenholtzii]SNB68489.1 hypothetical protein SAMN02746019_00013950 [Thermoflexus hugenholtzii JAD2]